MKKPSATIVTKYASGNILWLIKWPDVPMRSVGKSYYATTYPDSDLIFVETAAKRRPVSKLVGRNLLPIIRQAIEENRQ